MPTSLCNSASGSGSAYTCFPAVVSKYVKNSQVIWVPDVTSTVISPTLNLGPGPKTVTSASGTPLVAGSITGNTPYSVLYDGVTLRLIGGPPDNVPPVVTACGTGAVIAGTDRAGTVTEGTGASGCTITFHLPNIGPAYCVVSSQANKTFTYTITATAIVIVNVGAMAGGTKFNYVCNK